jgi:hypothetical protein
MHNSGPHSALGGSGHSCDKGFLRGVASLRGETPQRESPRLKPMPKTVVQPTYHSIIDGMRGILK